MKKGASADEKYGKFEKAKRKKIRWESRQKQEHNIAA